MGRQLKLTPALARRFALYLAGLLLLAAGTVLSINADLGVSTVTSLTYVFSLITEKSMSFSFVCIYSVYILIQILLLGKRFRPVNLLSILFTVVFGVFTDLAQLLIGGLRFESYFGRAALLIASIVLSALGVALYVGARVLPMPPEGMMLAVSERFSIPFHKAKLYIDAAITLCALLLSLVIFHSLNGVREGTILSALLAGRIVGIVNKYLTPRLFKGCFSDEQTSGGK